MAAATGALQADAAPTELLPATTSGGSAANGGSVCFERPLRSCFARNPRYNDIPELRCHTTSVLPKQPHHIKHPTAPETPSVLLIPGLKPRTDVPLDAPTTTPDDKSAACPSSLENYYSLYDNPGPLLEAGSPSIIAHQQPAPLSLPLVLPIAQRAAAGSEQSAAPSWPSSDEDSDAGSDTRRVRFKMIAQIYHYEMFDPDAEWEERSIVEMSPSAVSGDPAFFSAPDLPDERATEGRILSSIASFPPLRRHGGVRSFSSSRSAPPDWVENSSPSSNSSETNSSPMHIPFATAISTGSPAYTRRASREATPHPVKNLPVFGNEGCSPFFPGREHGCVCEKGGSCRRIY